MQLSTNNNADTVAKLVRRHHANHTAHMKYEQFNNAVISVRFIASLTASLR